ncbi:MAG: 3-oxoacyl-ACP synthase [Desulfobacterales bacterium]|nr:3-oxoacyl-ACP synthase [Desulfobacterales bacterium]
MSGMRIYLSGMGIVTPLGQGISLTKLAMLKGQTGIRPLTLFPTATHQPLPVGEVAGLIEEDSLPRTHLLARLASDQAMAESAVAPEAVVLGVTTGGMLRTESLLKNNSQDPDLFRYHALGSVTEDIARRHRCTGPALTVSTACSSGSVAIKLALQMMRAGLFKRVLTGGADSLCRLTYYGFNALQLIDPEGARPFDKNRQGMSVAEGAAMLLLVANEADNAVAEILGAGISCDAHHPVAPHPQGKGALAAMQAALQDAGIKISDIDYINLHGTGTIDNDISEARAVNALFPQQKPPLSSVKGAFGHSLAAAGAIEAVIAAIGIGNHLVPATIGCRLPDQELKLDPVMKPSNSAIGTVLSNSFGFGGNNAAVVIGECGKHKPAVTATSAEPLAILGNACVTGAGRTQQTMKDVAAGKPCQGMLGIQELSANLSARDVRRLKRFPRLALSLAIAAYQNSGGTDRPSAVFMGTGWGALSETFDFLTRLNETDEQFPSPTDFVGSVHNAAGGQIAIQFQATGANITMTGGDYSFEQSLLAADLLSRNIQDSFLVIGADEAHTKLSHLFDRSVSKEATLSDGGGALLLKRGQFKSGLYIRTLFYESVANNPAVITSLIQQLGGPQQINDRYGVLLAGIPAACRGDGAIQLQNILSETGYKNPVIDYRRITGEFASASAVAAVMAANFIQDGKVPQPLCDGDAFPVSHKGAIIIGMGKFITAMEIVPQ